MADFDRQLVESDAYLQLLIQQAQALQRRQEACSSAQERNRLATIADTVNVSRRGAVSAAGHATGTQANGGTTATGNAELACADPVNCRLGLTHFGR